ncbi:ABC transporter permease [Wenjunlia tyrosinilytica]|uniref:Transport permease protein n=1 Tax=Wenjunlia tyrosinilytica TaxID=1544741 RepID=A0A918DSR3_9ACTN|nr:ABC transporter permease [Wenjunlia tyrosinilytica]GGO81328.1 transport permease protein [Wenjunlia tyrosinilytica]
MIAGERLDMRAMIFKEFRELRRDRRTVAMLIVLPLVLLVGFGYAANFNVSHLKTDVVGPQAQKVAAALHQPFDVEKVAPGQGAPQARERLRDDKADVVVVTGSGKGGAGTVAYIDGSNLFAAQKATGALAGAGGQVEAKVLFNPDLKTSWIMVPALIGLILTFIGTIITSIGMVRERQSGTLEQLAVMPFKPSDVIIGKIAPYFLLAALDMIVVTVLGTLLFGVPFQGNAGVFAVGGALFLFVVLGVGVLISTVSQTQGQAIQLAMMTVMPQIIFSGMFFPLASMAAGVRWIGYLLPLTYFNMISQGIMLRGASAASLWLPLLLLTAMAVVVFSAAVLRFRRDLAPSRPSTGRATAAPPQAAEAGAR